MELVTQVVYMPNCCILYRDLLTDLQLGSTFIFGLRKKTVEANPNLDFPLNLTQRTVW
jgi:hypothetical protein